MKNRKLIISIIAIAELLLISVFGTLAWIEGTMEPSVVGERWQLDTAPGLVMKWVDPNTGVEGQYDKIYLDDYLNDSSSFTFSEVSSPNGINFFVREIQVDEENEGGTAMEEQIVLRAAGTDDENSNYIKVTFSLETEEGQKQLIYLDPERCYVRVKTGADSEEQIISQDAIRMALHIAYRGAVGSNSSHVFCVGERKSSYKAVSENFPGGVLDMSNPDHVVSLDPSNIRTFSDFSVGNTPIIALDPNDRATVTLCVWLEGMDEGCINDIAGQELAMSLYFTSATAGSENAGGGQ